MYFFWNLLLAHLLADFTFQTDRIAKWKRENISGVFFHVLIFLFFAVVVNYQYLPRRDFALALLLLGITHAVEDQWRVISVTKYHSHDNIFLFLYDQLVHILLIFILAPADPPYVTTEKWIYILLIGIIVTHFAMIFIYFLKKLFDEKTLFISKEKYHGIVERLLIFGCFIIAGNWFWLGIVTIVMLVIVERRFIRRFKKDLDFSVFNIVASNIIAVSCAILARQIWLM